MQDGLFDFIYVDGDHKYESVKRNLIDAKRLAKKAFSLVCGDDLERLPSRELLDIAYTNRASD